MAGERSIPESAIQGASAKDPILARLHAKIPTHNQRRAAYQKEHPRTGNPYDDLNSTGQAALFRAKRPDRTDIGFIAPAEGALRSASLDTITTIGRGEGDLSRSEVVAFAAASVQFLGGEQIAPGERVAKLPIENPTGSAESIIILFKHDSANIGVQDKDGEVKQRLVAGTNFATSSVDDHPAIVGSYGMSELPVAFSSPYKETEEEKPNNTVVLFDSTGSDSEMNPRELIQIVFEELQKRHAVEQTT